MLNDIHYSSFDFVLDFSVFLFFVFAAFSVEEDSESPPAWSSDSLDSRPEGDRLSVA